MFASTAMRDSVQANRRYLEEERRFNSTTPKAFLELIGFYVPRQQKPSL